MPAVVVLRRVEFHGVSGFLESRRLPTAVLAFVLNIRQLSVDRINVRREVLVRALGVAWFAKQFAPWVHIFSRLNASMIWGYNWDSLTSKRRVPIPVLFLPPVGDPILSLSSLRIAIFYPGRVLAAFNVELQPE